MSKFLIQRYGALQMFPNKLKTYISCLVPVFQIAQNEARVRELEAILKRDRAEHEDVLNMRDLEIRRLREAIEDQMTEYRDLLDIKIQLDLELVAYRKLLEGEESR